MEFAELQTRAAEALAARGLSPEYSQRLNFELEEIRKQGAELYWTSLLEDGKKFTKNPSHLVLPWLLNMVVDGEDPLTTRTSPMLNTIRAATVSDYYKKHGKIPIDFVKDPDVPDIDLDCLPKARDPIKQFAMDTYGRGIENDGYGPVCSVGTWQTYKFRSAIIDVCAATLLVEKSVAYALTTKLPDDVDELKEGGKAPCKGKIKDAKTGEEKECKTKHAKLKCPVCDSPDTDGPTLAKLLDEHLELRAFTEANPTVIKHAIQLVGRVRNMGMHAGALIIADRSLYGNIPMARNSKKGYWVSMWSEGRNTQLSKFGYIKWDILGLKTLEYIFNCCRFIEQNRGISFGEVKFPGAISETGDEFPPTMSGWDDINPEENKAGHFFDRHGVKHIIELNDPAALRLANEQKTDAVFQFDTDLAKSILANGVRNFEDLMLFNAMGHPGPMASIPEAVDNREDATMSWRNRLDKDILDVLKDTYGVIVYQEQLQAIWQRVAGFTAPEAQEARKAVAKKWTHKLKPIREKWLKGAVRRMSDSDADTWWKKMETFGRYAFNRSHAVSYCLVAHRCLWLKAHFAPEFWAAVMSDCHPDKLVRYMGVARSEGWSPTEITKLGNCPDEEINGVKFDTINLNNLSTGFTVTGNAVNQGLIGIKGIGKKAAAQFQGRGSFADIDDFVAQKGGKSKIVMERFIKLGAFRTFRGHENSQALWKYYLYKYCTGTEVTKLRAEVRKKLLAKDGWTDQTIAAEQQRQMAEYRKQFPNRRKMPPKIQNWHPKPDDSRERVMALFPEDFPLADVLQFEDKFFGYYLHSPLDLYEIQGDCNIAKAKEVAIAGGEPKLEVVIVDVQIAETKAKKQPYARMKVSDGMQETMVFVWNNELRHQKILLDEKNPPEGMGVQMFVEYDPARNTFTLCRGEVMVKLLAKGWRNARKSSGVPVLADA